MRNPFTTKKRIAIAVGAGALVLATGGTAFAYFTATGQGNGSASVGTAASWGVSQSTTTPPAGTIYPGSGSTVITFDVKNSSTSANQAITNPTVKMVAETSNGDAETTAGADITGCTATWFSPSVTNFPTADVAPGATVQVQVTVTMPALNVDQSKCESATPAVQLTVN